MWEDCSTCTFLGHVPRDSFIINLWKDSEICAYNKQTRPSFMKMGFLGHHLGISWHGINLFPPHCVQSLNLLQLSIPWTLQHTSLPCASLSPRVCSNTCYWVSDAIQPSHALLPPSPLALSLSHHHDLFQWVSSSLQGAKVETSALASVLLMNIQDWFPLGLTGLISLQFKGLSRVFSNTTVQKYQFFAAQLSLWSNSHFHTWLLEKP